MEAAAVRAFPWPNVIIFAGLLAVLFAQVLQVMVTEWAKYEEMGHGFFVPLVAGYIIWTRRNEILKIEPRPAFWGLPVVFFGFALLVMGTLGAEFFLTRIGFWLSLVGVVWAAGGWALLRALAFPLFLLLFMIRLPLFIYSQITFPLQILASQLAEVALSAIGIPVLRDGNILEISSQRLSVVEACSGIRSLLSLSFLSLVYAYFFDSKVWMRWVLLLATIPIAISANALRVTLTGVLSEYNKDLVEGFLHSFEGWLMFMVALAALIVLHLLINKVYSVVHARKAA
jgi:exosortase